MRRDALDLLPAPLVAGGHAAVVALRLVRASSASGVLDALGDSAPF